MKTTKSIIDLSQLPDATLKTIANEIVTEMAIKNSSASFSLKDATKAISNFSRAIANAKRSNNKTAVDIRNLTKEALIAVLNNIRGYSGYAMK
ncbi:MAG: hypothetical protein WDN26_14725 [Chitinophagaceae bacterium]